MKRPTLRELQPCSPAIAVLVWYSSCLGVSQAPNVPVMLVQPTEPFHGRVDAIMRRFTALLATPLTAMKATGTDGSFVDRHAPSPRSPVTDIDCEESQHASGTSSIVTETIVYVTSLARVVADHSSVTEPVTKTLSYKTTAWVSYVT
jgi:hypothetical protein